MIRLRSVVLPALAAVVVAGAALLGREGEPAHRLTPAGAATIRSGHVTVVITNYAYVPDRITVKLGTRVTWVNRDDTAHTATANDGRFATGTIPPGHRRTVDLTTLGSFGYHCVFHAFMTGEVTVVR